MRTNKGRKYVSTEFELHQYRLFVHCEACPCCGRVGFLISHGFLWGYSEVGHSRVVRGRRFFCSNRYRRHGCGGTFSVFLSDVLVGFIVRAFTLFRFLFGIFSGLSVKAAWERVAPSFSLQSGYRLFRRFRNVQIRIRDLLCRLHPPPDCSSSDPLFQLFDHLRFVFNHSNNPFSEFQNYFQSSLL